MKHYLHARTLLLLAVACLLLAAALPLGAAEGDIPQRGDIAKQDTWNLEDIYPSPEAWQADYERLEAALPAYEKYRGRLGESPTMLLECLKLDDSLGLTSGKLYVYAHLRLDEDQRVAESQERSGRIDALYAQVNAASAFIQPEILAIPGDKVNNWLKTAPELDVYRHYLENMLRTKEHTLSEGEERILAMSGNITRAPSDIFRQIDNSDMSWGTVVDENGQEVQLTRQRYALFTESLDRQVRRDAQRVYNKSYVERQNALATTLAASFKNDWFYAQSRGYNTCLERGLDAGNIPTSVFHSLIAAANANLQPLHKWASIRKRMLGVDTLRTYDLYAPLLNRPKKKYTWDEAKALVIKGLQPLGKQYLTDAQMGLDSRWIDVYETQGKESGGYNWGSYATHPYILMNYNGTMDEVFTLAHEMGHALHAHYTNGTEPPIYGGHSIFTAEVASTCNEAILMNYLLKNTTDKQDKIELLVQYIEQIIGTFYTQVMFSEFELAMHEHIENGGAFSPEFMRETYRKIYEKYWGPELVFEENQDIACLRVPHFYTQYYVYQYATCYAASQTVSQSIINKEPGALDRYMNFLKTGTSKYPVEVLRDAGVDMTTPDPVAKTIDVFGKLVDEVDKLLGEN
jgi:oligoendopeptidase F